MEINLENISEKLGKHYSEKFKEFGAVPRGVDWGTIEDTTLRYKNMLALKREFSSQRTSFLDVGCGYGGLLDYAISQDFELDYFGIDVAQNMIDYARENHPNTAFFLGDFLNYQFHQTFDYVVCNGILTQKLETSITEMEHFANSIIKKMFKISEIGIAFNVMSNRVNYMVDNLYYRSPTELMEYCFDHLSRKIKIDHSYPIYEYTVYVYK